MYRGESALDQEDEWMEGQKASVVWSAFAQLPNRDAETTFSDILLFNGAMSLHFIFATPFSLLLVF
jgi:hypothetical protein